MLTLWVIGTLLTMASADFYSSRYDDFDIQPLLENDRILQGYTKCFLDQGPCTPDAKDFKSGRNSVIRLGKYHRYTYFQSEAFLAFRWKSVVAGTILYEATIIVLEAIPEALETSCGKCTPKQKQLIRRVIRAVMERHRGSWDQLVEKYDPETKYREDFNKFIKEKD